jgi:hypothetical protein
VGAIQEAIYRDSSPTGQTEKMVDAVEVRVSDVVIGHRRVHPNRSWPSVSPCSGISCTHFLGYDIYLPSDHPTPSKRG